MKAIKELTHRPSHEDLFVEGANTWHDQKRTLRLRADDVARHTVVGRARIILLKSRVYLGFLTSFLDDLDNIGREIVGFVWTSPCYMLGPNGTHQSQPLGSRAWESRTIRTGFNVISNSMPRALSSGCPVTQSGTAKGGREGADGMIVGCKSHGYRATCPG